MANNGVNNIKKMNLVEKLHQNSIVDVVKKTDFDKGSDAPFIVELDTTEYCNQACPRCISGDLVCNSTSFSNDRLLSLGDEMIDAGVKGVILIGGGEPLAHPKAGELMQKFGENDVQLGITTNGTLLHKYQDVIAQHSHWTRVSVDAATDETYGKLRPNKAGKSLFHKVIRNMENLAKVKTGKLGFSFLLRTSAEGEDIPPNFNEIYEAAKLAREIGCDYFEVKPSYEFEDGKDHSLFVHRQEDMDHAREQINRAAELATENFSVVRSVNMMHALDLEQPGKQRKSYTTCPTAQLRTLVTPSGVYVCPYFRGKNQWKIGDVRENSFSDMWQSEYRKEVMDKMSPKRYCSGVHCIRHDTNLELFKMKEQQANNEMIDRIIREKEDRFI